MSVLDIVAWGAVTPIGLNAAQTYAAIRAGVRRFEPVLWLLPTEEPYLGARIPAATGLRLSERDWLLNLAARSLHEACAALQPNLTSTPVLWLVPPWVDASLGIEALEQRLGTRLAPQSRIHRGCAGELANLLEHARHMIVRGEVTHCLIGASDTLLDRERLERLRAMNRLHRNDNPQGMLASEGAAFVLIGRPTHGIPALARVLGFGRGHEPNPATGPGLSMGVGLREAFERALADSGCSESAIQHACINMNGERHAGIEAMLAHARCFRTRREALPVMLPAATTGELGVAAGVLGLIAAGMAMQRDHAHTELMCCEVIGDDHERSVIMLGRGIRTWGWYETLDTVDPRARSVPT